MRLLVVGSNGLLGSNVVHVALGRSWEVSGTFHTRSPAFDVPLTRFDLRNHDAFGAVLARHDPDVVVNCAAMTDVDGCEEEPERAHLLNGEAPGAIARHCEQRGISMVHVSTDYVFGGEEREPYTESADTNPLQAYGRSKLAGEQAVWDNAEGSLIPRLSFVWGVHRSVGELTGFPAWVRDRIRSGEDVSLFTDQWVTPTRGGQAAETLLDLIERGETGLVHVACSSCVTPYEFGTLLAETLDHGTESLVGGSMEDVDRAAARPPYSCLNVDAVKSLLGRPQPTLRRDIESVRDAL